MRATSAASDARRSQKRRYFQLRQGVLCGEDRVFEILEPPADEPLAIGKRLFPYVGVRDEVVVGLGDLQIVAEEPCCSRP
jgi:hypothetical protein